MGLCYGPADGSHRVCPGLLRLWRVDRHGRRYHWRALCSMSCSIGTAGAVGDELLLMPTRMRFAHVTICALHQCSGRVGHRLVVDTAQQPSRFAAGESRNRLYSRSSARLQPLWPLTSRSDGLHAVAARPPRYGGPAYNRLGSCNAACGRYRRRHQNGSLGRGAGHPSAELSLGSRGVMNRRTLSERHLSLAAAAIRRIVGRVSPRNGP